MQSGRRLYRLSFLDKSNSNWIQYRCLVVKEFQRADGGGTPGVDFQRIHCAIGIHPRCRKPGLANKRPIILKPLEYQ